MFQVLVLGAAAGGGFPQWNSNSEACQRARRGDPAACPATQASIAVSPNGREWFVVNAAPDLREQINSNPDLHPKEGLRSSPIAGIILTNGDVDAVAGLLHLRERTPFVIYAHDRILRVLEDNAIFGVLNPEFVEKTSISVGGPVELQGPSGHGTGLKMTAFPVPGKVALYLEDSGSGDNFGTAEGDTIGLEFSFEDRRVIYIANCAAISEEVRARCDGADVVFFDGTLYSDDEMIERGEGVKTGQRMGHMSMSGDKGSMAAFADVSVARKVFIHINNTNPALLSDSSERKAIEAEGWEVAYDGMEIHL
jgi:pyrroloquinoline quinone biosynthesis protein B